jgi:hypothetical protein
MFVVRCSPARSVRAKNQYRRLRAIGSVLIGPSFILTNDLTAGSAKMKFTRKQLFGLSVAILLFGGGVWANVVDGSLYQNKGAWVSHGIK